MSIDGDRVINIMSNVLLNLYCLQTSLYSAQTPHTLSTARAREKLSYRYTVFRAFVGFMTRLSDRMRFSTPSLSVTYFSSGKRRAGNCLEWVTINSAPSIPGISEPGDKYAKTIVY